MMPNGHSRWVAEPAWVIRPVVSRRVVSRCEFTHTGVPTVPKEFLETGSTLLKELDAPSSVSEFANVQAKLESDIKESDAGKMEGGCLREFTRFLEKQVHAAHRLIRKRSISQISHE